MAYRDNVQAAADKRNIPNPLEESDIAIASLTFWGDDGPIPIAGTDMNRAGRFFFQILAEELPRMTESLPGSLECDRYLREEAAKFFAERWENDTPIFVAIRTSKKVDLKWR